MDCPILQRPSQLQRFKVKDCDRLEFVSLSSNSLLQTPPEVTLENVREIVSFPKKLFKSPVTATELKCLGSTALKKIRVVNSKINSIKTRAIYNVTGMKSIEFENVTISDIESQGIEALMNDNTVFSILNSNIENVDFKGITIKTTSATISDNQFNEMFANALNITSDYVRIIGNTFNEINGLILKAVSIDISNNIINLLKSNAFTNVKCLRRINIKRQFSFTKNTVKNVESRSLIFDYASCKTAGATVAFNQNTIDCKCRNIEFLNTGTSNRELNNLILDMASNNTCLNVPCSLPVEVVKLLMESSMCHLSLDAKVMCLLYNDRHAKNNEVTTDEDITIPAPTFYLIRPANSPKGDASAITAIDKDDLLKDSHLNMTNRTTVKIVFDSTRDFVETLRSTSTTNRKVIEEHKNPPKEDFVNNCVGHNCHVSFDKQKALDFYKYVYAQLRSPIQSYDKEKT